MKFNTYCFEKNNIWYFRKRIPLHLNKKNLLFRKSLKKLLGKQYYYTSLLNGSLFTIINFINNNVECLLLKKETITLEELNQYIKDLLYKYKHTAFIEENGDHIANIGKDVTSIEDKRFSNLDYFDENGVKYGGHTPLALNKELDELINAYDTDNLKTIRQKASDILKRQDILSNDEIRNIDESKIIEFEKNLVKTEINIIDQALKNYHL